MAVDRIYVRLLSERIPNKTEIGSKEGKFDHKRPAQVSSLEADPLNADEIIQYRRHITFVGRNEMKKRTLVLFVTMLVLASLPAAAALAKGVNPAQLSRAGWNCFNAGPNMWVHCISPGSGASPATLSVRVFDTKNVSANEAEFLGTELLIHVSIYNDQPCPQLTDPGAERVLYEDLRETPDPLPYYACHHFETAAH
jgi:hypothetical protein